MAEHFPNMKAGDAGGFPPIAYQDHNLVIHNNLGVMYRRVDFWEEIAPFQCFNFGALAAGVRSAALPLGNLDMPDDELAQIRWYMLDNAQVYVFLPGGTQKSMLKNLAAPFDMNTPLRNPNLECTELFIWEDNRPSMQAVNGMAVALAAIRIIAGGYRFHTFDLQTIPDSVEVYNSKGIRTPGRALAEAIRKGLEPATHIWTSGRGQGTM